MPNPPSPDAKLREAVEALNEAIAAGYQYPGIPSAVRAAAAKLGISPGTFNSRVKRAYDAGYSISEVPEHKTDAPAIEVIAKPRIRVKVHSTPDAPTYRVIGIGDAHDSPTLPDKSRFKWMARYAAAVKPDYVVQIGDVADFDSLSRHDIPGSLSQKLRPSYAADMNSLEEALTAFYKEGAGLNVHITLGNHERRVQRYEQGTAEIEGTLWQPLMDLFARYNWRTHDEGEFLFIGGVGFVHAPRTLMNREYAGKTMNAIANDAMFSIVFGHSHRGQILHAPKIGPTGGVTILNLGTSLPTGYVKEYAKVAMTSWTHGLWDITIQAGKITGHQFLSMTDLEALYGD